MSANSNATKILGNVVTGTTGTTSTNLVYSTSPTLTTPTIATSLTGSYLTASEMLGTGASKEIVSLPVATYPSLTELTYLKGVTSAIQTQINAKGVGDMVLASAQTVTGAKTFNDTKFLMRNVANTFNGTFTNTNTADRTYTLPDRALTIDNITTATTTNGTGFVKGNGSVISFDNSTYLTSVGTGVANEITYWSGTSTLGSLATATYPSLTELSYVKGVTSAVQTQINGKANSAGALTQFVGNNNWKVFYSDGSGDVQELALGASGEFLKSNGASSVPSFAAPSGGGLTWTATTVNATMAVANGYIANKGTLLTMTLPSTSAVGTTVRIVGMNAGLWRIAQAASQYIKFGNKATTAGTGGYIESTLTYDAIELVCIETDLGWVATSSVGSLTVV